MTLLYDQDVEPFLSDDREPETDRNFVARRVAELLQQISVTVVTDDPSEPVSSVKFMGRYYDVFVVAGPEVDQ